METLLTKKITPHKNKFTPHTQKIHSSYTKFCFVPGTFFDGLEFFLRQDPTTCFEKSILLHFFCFLENKNGEALTQSRMKTQYQAFFLTIVAFGKKRVGIPEEESELFPVDEIARVRPG